MFSKNKKGIELSLVHLLGILLGIGMILVLIIISVKISGLFIGKQDFDATANNMEVLSLRVQQMVDEQTAIVTETTSYHIADKYVLVGFSYDDKGSMGTTCLFEDIIDSRPKTCKSRSCLCIYEGGNGERSFDNLFHDKGSAPLKCHIFKDEDKIVFISQENDLNFLGYESPWSPHHYGNFNYHNLVIFGRCDQQIEYNPRLQPKSFGVKRIYIEKYYDGINNFVYIGDLSNENVRLRYSRFDPAASDIV